ncbi:MAG: succinate dehydrogenase cytochrome b subunit [Cyclobacteriaceae bacterium]
MSWVVQTLTSSIGKKVIMALSGLFLIIFLIGHLSGNFLLLKSDGGKAFNEYAEFMTTNQIVQVIRYILYAGILLHIFYAIALTIYNNKARPVGYKMSRANENSSWISRNMGLLGTLIAVFLVIHLRSFWYRMKFGEMPEVTYESVGTVKDLYAIVYEAFAELWYTGLYVVLMVFLALHLAHGFHSAFRTLGLRHSKYLPIVKNIGLAFAIIVPALFASLAVVMYIKSLG